MSDVETTATPTKSSAWTEEAKVELLLRIIVQLREDGKQVNWSRINMPGRTLKSMQNMWTKFNKEIAELKNEEGADGGGGGGGGGSKPATPTRARATPRGRGRPKKSEAIVAPGASDDEDDNKVTPKKRGAGRAAANSASKRIKKDDEEDVIIKEDVEGGVDELVKTAESEIEESVEV
ncbi:hypothetical protein JDV02_007674 [Purpureocillium takamizusanense]|uniref:Uncharacterized protein n=1 Tax=Purpureocillium takamizusanense TaxID=2060973 RepID=A0A9Q8VED6_9HYPO|nr:uncharacterized protein JDV02_007674 [Purpureocillium takamizusanense]UNI21707.1 hypothetical protein JDV02_007674 [Purpureocillium takamizusanense]